MIPDAAALQALESGTIPAQDLMREVLADRDRLLSEIYRLRVKIVEQERCLGLAAQMIDCMQTIGETGR